MRSGAFALLAAAASVAAQGTCYPKMRYVQLTKDNSDAHSVDIAEIKIYNENGVSYDTLNGAPNLLTALNGFVNLVPLNPINRAMDGDISTVVTSAAGNNVGSDAADGSGGIVRTLTSNNFKTTMAFNTKSQTNPNFKSSLYNGRPMFYLPITKVEVLIRDGHDDRAAPHWSRNLELYTNSMTCSGDQNNFNNTMNFARTRITVANDTATSKAAAASRFTIPSGQEDDYTLFTWSMPAGRVIKATSLTLAREAPIHFSDVEILGWPVVLGEEPDFGTDAERINPTRAIASSTLYQSNAAKRNLYDVNKIADASVSGRGITGTNWHSLFNDPNPTATLDLGAEYYVSEIKISSRRDCCAQRSMGTQVIGLDKNAFPSFPVRNIVGVDVNTNHGTYANPSNVVFGPVFLQADEPLAGQSFPVQNTGLEATYIPTVETTHFWDVQGVVDGCRNPALGRNGYEDETYGRWILGLASQCFVPSPTPSVSPTPDASISPTPSVSSSPSASSSTSPSPSPSAPCNRAGVRYVRYSRDNTNVETTIRKVELYDIYNRNVFESSYVNLNDQVVYGLKNRFFVNTSDISGLPQSDAVRTLFNGTGGNLDPLAWTVRADAFSLSLVKATNGGNFDGLKGVYKVTAQVLRSIPISQVPDIARVRVYLDPATETAGNYKSRSIEVFLNSLNCKASALRDGVTPDRQGNPGEEGQNRARTHITGYNRTTRGFVEWNFKQTTGRTVKLRSFTIAQEMGLALSRFEIYGRPIGLNVPSQIINKDYEFSNVRVTSSSVLNNAIGYSADNILDKSFNTMWHSSFNDVNPTVTVDLGREFDIDWVRVHSRRDCCSSRAYGGRIEFLDSFGNPVPVVDTAIPVPIGEAPFLMTSLEASPEYYTTLGRVTDNSCGGSAEDEYYGYWTAEFPICAPSSSPSPSPSSSVSVSPSATASTSPSASVSPTPSVSPSPSSSVTPSVTPSPSSSASASPSPVCGKRVQYIRYSRDNRNSVIRFASIKAFDANNNNILANPNYFSVADVQTAPNTGSVTNLFDGSDSTYWTNSAAVSGDSSNGSGGATGFGAGVKIGLPIKNPGGVYPRIKRIEIVQDTATQNFQARDIELYINKLSCTASATNFPDENARTRLTFENSTGTFVWNAPAGRTFETRYITLGREAAVHISEIQAYSQNDVTQNLARFQTNPGVSASSSTSLSVNYNATKVIDGTTGTNWHSLFNDEQPSVTVNLGQEQTLSHIRIHSRKDCCSTRVYGGIVEAFNVDPALNPNAIPIASMTLGATNLNIEGYVTGCPAAFEDEVRGFWELDICRAGF